MSSSKSTVSSVRAGRARPARSKHSPSKRRDRQPQVHLGREILSILFGILWILVGLVLIGSAFGAWYACNRVSDVLSGIEPYTEPRKQIERYETFFDELNKNAFKVSRDKPQIVGQETHYFWQVKVLGTGESRTFNWKLKLSERQVLPLGNPALQLDVHLGYLDSYGAVQLARESGINHNPEDRVVQAIVGNDIGVLNLEEVVGESDGLEAYEPVMAPRLTPEEAANRESGPPEEEAEGTDSGAGSHENQSTDVDTGGGGSGSVSPPSGGETDIVID